MEANIFYEYGKGKLMELIDAEVSRHGAFLRYQDGRSAYDDLKIHTNDRPVIENYVADAFRAVQTKFESECSYWLSNRGVHSIGFYLPDFDQDYGEQAQEEIERYVVLSSTARWLMARAFGEYAKMVATDAESSMNRIVNYLRARKFPI